MFNTYQSESHEVKAIAFRGRIVLKQIQEQKTTTDLLGLDSKKTYLEKSRHHSSPAQYHPYGGSSIMLVVVVGSSLRLRQG